MEIENWEANGFENEGEEYEEYDHVEYEQNLQEEEEVIRGYMESQPDYRRFWNLTAEQAADQMNQLVNETSVTSKVPPNICRVLLYKYKWDSSRFIQEYGDMDPQEFYEKNDLVPLSEVIFSRALTSLLNATVDEGEDFGKLTECPICCNEVSSDETAEAGCGDTICLSCWKDHISFKVDKEGCGIIVLCPACPFILSDQFIKEVLPNKEILNKLVASQVSTFVDSHPMLTWCPGAKCTGSIIRVDSLNWGPGPIICNKCTTEFCIACKRNWHAPICCEFVEIWEREVQATDTTTEWIRGNSKPCPKCGVPIEKNGGCNYMTCSNKDCGYHFCWICLGKAHQHNFGTTCSKVNPESLEKINRQREDTQKSLQHFVFHSERYLSHMRSLELEENLEQLTGDVLHRAILKYGTKIVNIDRVGIVEAVRTLRRCRRMLAYGYAFMFYLPTDSTDVNKNEKLVYERNLNDLNGYTERLSFLLEQDLGRALNKGTPAEFEEQRCEVIRIAQYCDSRRIKIVSHVMENCERGIWNMTELTSPQPQRQNEQ